MADISVNAFLRSNCVLNWFGPKKTSSEGEGGRGALRLPALAYQKQVEMFVYNTTARIANGTLITAVIAVAAAALSCISLFCAVLLVAASVAIHFSAEQSMPTIEPNTEPSEAGEENEFQMWVTIKDPKESVAPNESWVEQHFGLDSELFRSTTGDKTTVWAQHAFSVGGKDKNLIRWHNQLPTPPAQRAFDPSPEGTL